jgi:hypothetical protein
MAEEINEREVVFEDMNGFHSFITDKGLNLISEEVRQFHDSFKSINIGCGCSRKSRVNRAENLYLGVPSSLDEHRRYLLHRVLSEGKDYPCERIVFKHNGEQFSEVEFEVY